MIAPIIDSYEKFVKFNIKLVGKNPLVLIEVDLKLNTVKYTHLGSETILDTNIDEFLLYIVKVQRDYIHSNIELLKAYNFDILYSQTHPKKFKDKLYSYVNNLIMMGENSFILWDFEISVDKFEDGQVDLKLMKYVGDVNSTHLTIPIGVTSIKDEAAFGRVIPNKVTLISVTLPSTLRVIGCRVFEHSSIKEITIPNSVEIIDESAFRGCHNLKFVKLSKNLVSIRQTAFQGTGLREIDIPSSVQEIKFGAFRNCSNLSKVTLHEGLKVVQAEAFNAIGIEEIRIPNTVYALGNGAFLNCSKLEKVKMGKISEIGTNTFGNTPFGRKNGLYIIEEY